MSKGSKILVIVLFVITLALSGVAVFVSRELSVEDNIDSEDASAASCLPGCCGGSCGSCSNGETCDVANGACSSGTSCRAVGGTTIKKCVGGQCVNQVCMGDNCSDECSSHDQCGGGNPTATSVPPSSGGGCSTGADCGNSCEHPSSAYCVHPTSCGDTSDSYCTCVGVNSVPSGDTCGGPVCAGEFSGCSEAPACPAGQVECSPGESGCEIGASCNVTCNSCGNPSRKVRYCKQVIGSTPTSPPENTPTLPPNVTPTPTLPPNVTPTPTLPPNVTPTPTPTPTPPPCGNGSCDTGEACDGNSQCTGGGEFTDGECRAPGTVDQCTYCGDGIIQTGEECDDGNTNPSDGCNNDCRLVADEPTPTPPPNCGDGLCNPGEACDINSQCLGGGMFTNGECRVNCTYCGDGVVQPGEQCDDGNISDNDSCNNLCQSPIPTQPPTPRVYCGDGIMQPGEECEAAIPNSCGPGGECNPYTCRCNPTQPGLCGSQCTTSSDCPVDNTCYNGTCRLDVCVPGRSIALSSPVSGMVSGSLICTNNGCDVVQCGTQCGDGGICPTGLACSQDNICVIPYCLRARCSDVCELPATALIAENIDMYILSVLLILFGLIAYRTDVGVRLIGQVEEFGDTKFGNNLYRITGVRTFEKAFKSMQRKFNAKYYKKSSRKKFEDKFDDDN